VSNKSTSSTRDRVLRTAVRTTAVLWLLNSAVFALFAFLGVLSAADPQGGDGGALGGIVVVLLVLAALSLALAPLLWLGRRFGYWLSAATSGLVCAFVVYFWLTTSWELSGLAFVLTALPLGVSVTALALTPATSEPSAPVADGSTTQTGGSLPGEEPLTPQSP
jgi:hypothetical protein